MRKIISNLRPLKTESDSLLHLDVLRFLAACGIVYHHSHEFFYAVPDRAGVMVRTASLGLFVSLFFMISGFVIAFVYSSRMASIVDFGRFMRRRVGRLVPLHLLTLLVAVLVGFGIVFAKIEMSNAPELSVKCIATTAALLHSIIDCGGLSFNGVTWSISVEVTMYVLFPLLVVIFARGKYLAVIAGVVLGLIAIWLSHYRVDIWERVPILVRALPAFLFGMGLYYARTWVARLPQPVTVLALSFIALVYSMLNGYPTAASILCYIVAASGVATDLSGRRSAFIARVAPLGQLTYSIYMTHYLVILVVLNGIGDKLLRLDTLPMILLSLLVYALVGIISYISYQYFETPARRWIDGSTGLVGRHKTRTQPEGGTGENSPKSESRVPSGPNSPAIGEH